MPRKSALRKVAAAVVLLGGVALMSGCATEQSRTLEVAKVAAAGTTYNGPRSLIAVGKFDYSPAAGIGIVEGVMPLALSSLRVPWSQAMIITLAYRGITFWIPLGLGAIAFRLTDTQKKKVSTPPVT